MLRRLSIVLVIALLAFTTACNSNSSSTGAAAGGGSTVSATASSSTCPATETKKFAKTEFVADVALAGGAFKRYIYKPAKLGKFEHGAHGKVLALVKAAAAGAFTINRLHAALVNVQSDPTLCKVLIAPLKSFSAAVSALVGKAKSGLGAINPGDVTSGDGLLSGLHNAASQAGTSFTDNENAQV